jgi:drug/metabolite transporter (DMT)-like permease
LGDPPLSGWPMKIFVWLLLCVIWGTTWIFIKIGLEDLPPITFATSRFALAVLILAPLIKLLKFGMPRGRSQWNLIALTGFLQFSVNYSLVFWSEQYITSGLAAVLQAMITVFGLLLAWIFLPSETITRRKVLAVLLGVVGVAVIFIDQLRVESIWAFAGCVAIVVGAYGAAQASILIKARGAQIHPASLVFTQMIFGLPAIIIYALAVEGNPLKLNWTYRAFICVVYLTVLGTIAAFWLYYWLLKRVESTKAMMISLVTPLLAVIIGAITIGETLPPQTFAGGMLIISSVGLIVLRRRSNGPRTQTGTDINEFESANMSNTRE